MQARYSIGQKVTIRPVTEQSLSARDSTVRKYTGLTGEITNYHWITPPTGEFFCLYTVRVAPSNADIVLYEDEMEHMPGLKPGRHKSKA